MTELHSLLNFAVNYGLGIVLSIIIVLVLIKVLMYTLQENSKREERLAGIIQKDLAQVHADITAHDTRTAQAIGKFEQTAQYQREEHSRMIGVLDKICEKMNDCPRENK